MTTLTRYAVQCRSEVRGDTLYGHGAVFGVLGKVPGGYERLHERAFDAVMDSTDTNVIAAVEHDMGRILGRQSAGTLRLKVDERGLAFEVDLDDTPDAVYVRSKAARGELGGASIGFLPADDEWGRAPDGTQVRTITSIGYLRDVSVVSNPAYGGTEVELRNYDFARPDGRTQLIRARARARNGERT